MSLHERSHPQLVDEPEQARQGRLVERCHDQQHEVGTSGTSLQDLVRLGYEVFAQHGKRRGSTNRFEVFECSAELAALGQDADRARSAKMVRLSKRCRIRNLGKSTARRAGPLDLGDDVYGVAGRKSTENVERGCPVGSLSFEVGKAA